jgi:hypothetical protein
MIVNYELKKEVKEVVADFTGVYQNLLRWIDGSCDKTDPRYRISDSGPTE